MSEDCVPNVFCLNRCILGWQRRDSKSRLMLLRKCRTSTLFSEDEIRRFSKEKDFRELPKVLQQELNSIL